LPEIFYNALTEKFSRSDADSWLWRTVKPIMTTEEIPIDLHMLDTVFGKDGREDILSTFISHSEILYARIEAAFAQNDIETIVDVAHQLKGMCASIYATELSGKALVLERLAKESDPDWVAMTESYAVVKRGFTALTNYLSTIS
jgi:HPt (histidine-containing phosphotransfer) domain-containing protein